MPSSWWMASWRWMIASWCLVVLLWPRPTTALLRHDQSDDAGSLYIGTGIYDMTGPAAQINFMGYAKAGQTGHGIHMRLRSRAFIVSQVPNADHQTGSSLANDDPTVDTERGLLRSSWKERLFGSTVQSSASSSKASQLDPETTICFVSIDAGMGSDLLNLRVLERLEELLPPQTNSTKRLCHLENLSISGTHTHSAPAGFLQYALYQVTSSGFSKEVFHTYVEGVAQSIVRAFENLEQGSIRMAKDILLDANINRSPTSYLLNPQSERDEYADHGDTDKTMLQLTFQADIDDDEKPKGLLNWFAVHGTSMNSSNLLISGDNKGYASYLMEKHINGNDMLPGQGSFVAAFASTNLGDVSPNTAGPRCLDTRLPCDLHSSTCNGKNAMCVAFGPGKDMKESTGIIGRKQYEASRRLLHRPGEILSGSVAFRHSFIDMSNKSVMLEDGTMVRTCPAALGYAFAAGTTDGPGAFDFSQGQNSSNPFWNIISGFLSAPSDKQKDCHAPKPILLNTGGLKLPYPWDPQTVPISVLKIGKLFILSVPCEFTTMAGRRLRKAVTDVVERNGFQTPEVTIAGLANSYTHYVTTFEEYAGQRYEAASTLYGPYTLDAYIQEFIRITEDLLDGKNSTTDHPPRNLSRKQISLIPPVAFDSIGIGQKFGSVAVDADQSYVRGLDTAFVSFRSANPRHNQRIEGTFLTVDFLQDDGNWKTKFVDGDWSTSYYWKHSMDSFGVSFAEISWEIPEDVEQGIYRICHYGTRKTIFGDLGWATMHSPDWWSLDGFGCIAVGVFLQGLKLVERVSDRLCSMLSGLERAHMRDFSGCSRSFLVRNA